MRGRAKGGAPLGVGASGTFVGFLGLLQPPHQLIRSEPFPGQHLPHRPVDLRPGDPGHLFPPKPVADSTETLRPAGTGPRDDASPPRACPVLDTGCGSRTRPAPRRFFPSRTRFQCATATLPLRPGSPGKCPPGRWTGSSGARCRPGSGGRRPSGFRQASAYWSTAPAGR